MHAGRKGFTNGNVRIEYTIDTAENMAISMLRRVGSMWEPVCTFQTNYYEWCKMGMSVHAMLKALKKDTGTNDDGN